MRRMAPSLPCLERPDTGRDGPRKMTLVLNGTGRPLTLLVNWATRQRPGMTGDDSREAHSGREEGVSLGWFVYCLPSRPLACRPAPLSSGRARRLIRYC